MPRQGDKKFAAGLSYTQSVWTTGKDTTKPEFSLEFDPGNSHGGRRELSPPNLTSDLLLCGCHATYTPTHVYV